ncbi:MAG: efflux RND transporter periplasmic adaptor subunit [Bacteroidota bacterium]
MYKSLIIASVCAVTLLSACKEKKEEVSESNKYTVTNPVKMDTSFIKEYVAQIQSIQNVELRAQVKGYLETINVDEGQMVKAGQVLFTIRPLEYQAELLKATAEVKAAEIEVANAKKLADKNIVSSAELASAQANLEKAKAEESLAALYVTYTTIKAPFDGVIDRIKFKVGSLIDEGGLLTTISNNKDVYAYFNVSEPEYLNFKSQSPSNGKQEVKLILANNQPHKYSGTIETVEGEFDNNTGTIPFRAKFPNPDLLLKHGETGKVQLTMKINDALIIPQKATYEMQDRTYVYVVNDQNVVASRNVVIKQKLSNLYIIESGLNENDKILLDGIQMVKDDDKIVPNFMDGQQVLSQLK